ncbi:MAG: oligoendopeptidase F [Clostridia bacterium]|nr:oligoendopeptidase F [Clostridia bacterium]
MEKLTYDWNLQDIYKNEDDFFADFDKYKILIRDKIKKFNGKLKDKESVLEYFNLNSFEQKLATKIFCYVSLRQALDGKDEFSRKVEGDYAYFAQEVSPQLIILEDQLYKIKNSTLLEWAVDSDFADYDLALKDLVQQKKHKQPAKIEAVLAKNSAFGLSREVFDKFDDVDLKFGFVNTPEGKVELTHATYGKLIEHPDQKVRKETFEKTHEAFKNFNYTLGSLYLGGVDEKIFFVDINKYKNALEMNSQPNKISTAILPTLIDVVNENLGLFYRFEQIKKKYLGLKKYYSFDNYVPIGKMDKKFDYEKGAELVCDALKVLGDDYVNVVKKALTEGWIDVFEKPAKTSGGFSLGVYGVHPYILLNYTGTYECVSTLAHELGHTMHSYLSDKNQVIDKSDYSIFVAEVASIVNEIILSNFMLERCESKQEKIFCLNQILKQFYTTLYRQTMFSEFEHFVFTSKEQKKPLIVENLNEFYKNLQHKYFGDDTIMTENAQYEWSRIPHFYRPYYVYKYATGFISACIIAGNLLKGKAGYKEKYLKFLSAGSSVYPVELLKTVDVDLTKKKTLQGAFELYAKYLDEFEKLVKEEKL